MQKKWPRPPRDPSLFVVHAFKPQKKPVSADEVLIDHPAPGGPDDK